MKVHQNKFVELGPLWKRWDLVLSWISWHQQSALWKMALTLQVFLTVNFCSISLHRFTSTTSHWSSLPEYTLRPEVLSCEVAICGYGSVSGQFYTFYRFPNQLWFMKNGLSLDCNVTIISHTMPALLSLQLGLRFGLGLGSGPGFGGRV